MKYAENLVAKNIAKTTGIRSGTEVEFSGLVCVVVLELGVRYNYAVAAGEKKKDKGLILYCRFKTYLNNYNNYVLQQWAVEEED